MLLLFLLETKECLEPLTGGGLDALPTKQLMMLWNSIGLLRCRRLNCPILAPLSISSGNKNSPTLLSLFSISFFISSSSNVHCIIHFMLNIFGYSCNIAAWELNTKSQWTILAAASICVWGGCGLFMPNIGWNGEVSGAVFSSTHDQFSMWYVDINSS